MAGNTKCYKVQRRPDGTLDRKVVEHSPKAAHSVTDAVARLRAGDYAYVPFHEYGTVEELLNQPPT